MTETQDPPTHHRAPRRWPVLLLALPAFVAIWSGWVGLGELAGFGPVHPLPGIADDFEINSAITLPIGMEVYSAYALHAWLSGHVRTTAARTFAKYSALAALTLGGAGQVAYHLMSASGIVAAPWPITTAVACIPVAVLGMAAVLAHLLAQPADLAHAVHDDAAVRTPETVHDTDDAHAQRADRAHDDRAQDVAQDDADVAQPVRKVSQRVRVDAQRAHDAVPMHSARALPASTAVRTVSLVKDRALCTSPNGVRNVVHSDRWTDAAERLCKADPSGRRDVRTVETILRLHHVDGLPHARIAAHTGCSASTVSRTLTAARAHVESN
ncbi:sigma-70 region 4 domain-containing protein [Nocardia vinacea]|uniref:Sigma-70 region 4 domain-containing protein n=1 Tax=Nocardia vinacea TaxID=96468 RepID=A0ABZ1YYN8_9NOCA|nr:sigma-70 region 4 domain-containing protein [Nocardia vinacea]